MAFPKSRILSASKFIQVFKESAENKQRFCFILGSGASVDSDIPTGNELEMQWMDELMYKDPSKAKKRGDPTPEVLDEETEKLRKDIRELAEKLYDDDEMTHRFSEIEKAWEEARKKKDGYLSSEYYFDLYKLRFHPNPQNGYRFLEQKMDDKEPSLGYRVLSLLLTKARKEEAKKEDRKKEYELEDSNQHNLVITTNFDSLTEDALFLYSDKKPLVISHESLAAYIDSDTQRPIIAKVHRGLMFDPFNSPDTTDHLEKEWHEALDYAFKTYTPVVIGYGGGDGSLMTYLQQSTSNKGIYWCYLPKYGLPGPAIQKFVRRRNGCLVKIDGFDKFMLELGLTMFPNEIMPPSTSEYLKKQMENRVKNYTDQYNKKRQTENVKDILPIINSAEEKYEEDMDKKPKLNAWEYFFRASRKCIDGDFSGAIRDYDKAIELDPNYAAAYNNRGNSYATLMQYERSIQNYDKAIELNPNDAAAYNNRGNSYHNLKQYERAIQDYHKAIELDPNDANAYYNRGNSYSNLKQYELAIQDYDKAIELAPNYALAYNNRGVSYHDLKQYERAIQDYNKAIELDPNYAAAYNNRGTSYHDLKQYDRAIQDYNKAIELKPGYILAYRNRAKAYRAIGKTALAEADEAKVAELEAKQNKKDNP